MPRIPYPDPSRLADSVREVVNERPANITRMLAVASESVFHAFLQLGNAFITGSSLPADLREIAILRVGHLSRSAYEIFQHEALARHVGLTDQQIAAVSGDCSAAEALGEVGSKVLAYVDDLVMNVRAGDETLAEVRRHLTDTQVVDLTLVTGAYMMVSRLLETTGIEIDAAAINWTEITEP